MLRPTPGDPWGVEQHHWNTGAEENQQLNPGGPSNRQQTNLKRSNDDTDNKPQQRHLLGTVGNKLLKVGA